MNEQVTGPVSFNDLRRANDERQIQWEAGLEFELTYLGNALAGEVGEACNIIKKMARQKLGAIGSTANASMLANELADVIIYADLIARKIGFDLGEAVRKKFNATSERYKLGAKL